MKELRLSNGVSIQAYVGDGFDGSSGIQVCKGREQMPLFGFPISDQDRVSVLELLKWYVREELKLRRWEGRLWRHDQKQPTIESASNPYDIMFQIGHIEGVILNGDTPYEEFLKRAQVGLGATNSQSALQQSHPPPVTGEIGPSIPPRYR